MSGLLDTLLTVPAWAVLLLTGLLVFAEDALFVGFVLPGETAVVLGGVAASQGTVGIVPLCIVVVVAAVVGDSVGYELGRIWGTKVLASHRLDRWRPQLDKASNFLQRKGASAVFLGRFTAFFRAVMPALAGSARMPYRRFLPWNMLGGLIWGIAFSLVGYLAGNSYKTVEKTVGRTGAIVVVVIVVLALVVRHFRGRHKEEHGAADTA